MLSTSSEVSAMSTATGDGWDGMRGSRLRRAFREVVLRYFPRWRARRAWTVTSRPPVRAGRHDGSDNCVVSSRRLAWLWTRTAMTLRVA